MIHVPLHGSVNMGNTQAQTLLLKKKIKPSEEQYKWFACSLFIIIIIYYY